jgi:hypothetical protein
MVIVILLYKFVLKSITMNTLRIIQHGKQSKYLLCMKVYLLAFFIERVLIK